LHFRKATFREIPEIKKLWKEVFGDANDYISRFITHFGIENCYICEINNAVVAMAFAIPTNLKSPSNFEGVPVVTEQSRSEGRGSLSKIIYIYACATHPDFQSQGIMKMLIETVYNEACKENYAGIFLQAAHQPLIRYYQELGFEAFFFRDHSFYYNHKEHEEATKYTKSDKGINPIAVSSELCENPLRPLRLNIISPENYYQKRRQKLKNHCFVNWNEDFFRFLNESGTQFCEYKNTIFSFKTHINTIIVDELLGETPHEQIADLLFEKLPDFEVVHIRSMGNEFCCGQIKWCCLQTKNHPKCGWLGFAME